MKMFYYVIINISLERKDKMLNDKVVVVTGGTRV